LATTESNYRWLGGHSSQAWQIKSRPIIAVLPQKGDPFLVVPGSERSGAGLTSWIRDVRTFGSLHEPGIAELIDGLRARGITRGAIGCELGAGHRFGLTLRDFQILRERLADICFNDAGDIFWNLRRRKSPAEIAYLSRSATATSAAAAATLEATRAGWSERQIYQTLARNLMDRGAERLGYMPVNADTHAPDSTTGGPTDRRTAPGKMVYMGAGCLIRGYWSDAVRCFTVDRASSSQQTAYRVIREASRRCTRLMRPGASIADICKVSLATFEEAGLLANVNARGRIGHGTGLDLSEPPSISLDEPGVLEPGMVLYFEPNCQTAEGNFMVEETYLITEDGCEKLGAEAPEELPVLA
jgi:Xaa-Pro aminopeptidase